MLRSAWFDADGFSWWDVVYGVVLIGCLLAFVVLVMLL